MIQFMEIDPRIVSGVIVIVVIFIILYLSGVFNKDKFVGTMKFYSAHDPGKRTGSHQFIKGGEFVIEQHGTRLMMIMMSTDGNICVYTAQGPNIVGSHAKFSDGLLAWCSNTKIRDGYSAVLWIDTASKEVKLCEANPATGAIENCLQYYKFEEIFADLPSNVNQFLFKGQPIQIKINPGPEIPMPPGIKL